MLGAAAELQGAISSLELHAAVNFQVSDGIELLRGLRDTNGLGSMVVVHLGNNGTFNSAQLDEMMDVLSGVESVVFVSLRVPRSWEEGNNAMLAEGVDRFANAALIDWHAISDSESAFFWQDGLHLRPAGAKVYAELIGSYAASLASPAVTNAQP
jgi:hypothetical protein